MIYLLEDDDSIRKLVIYALQSQGYEAAGFERPSEFWHAMGRRLPELVLLDVMLPEEDGLSVLKKLRSATATAAIPVIMLTGGRLCLQALRHDGAAGPGTRGAAPHREEAAGAAVAGGPTAGVSAAPAGAGEWPGGHADL